MIGQKGSTTNHWTKIAELTPESREINLRFLVLEKRETRQVSSMRTGKRHEIAECIIGDSTGKINLLLWNEDVDLVIPHYSYEIRGAHISVYEECMSLSKDYGGDIKRSEIKISSVNLDQDMSRPFMGNPKRRKRPRSEKGRTFDGSTGREIRKFCGRKSF